MSEALRVSEGSLHDKGDGPGCRVGRPGGETSAKIMTTPSCSDNCAGLDVAAATLQLSACLRASRFRCCLRNDPTGHRELLRRLPPGTRVCLEATGLHHLEVATALVRAGRPVQVLNPRAAKDYQRSRLVRAKTDGIDADGLLDHAQHQPFAPWTPPPSAHLALRQISRRLVQLAQLRTAEHNRLWALGALGREVEPLRRELRQSLRQVRARTETLVRQALALVQADPGLNARLEWLCSLKGIAQRSALLLLGELSVLPADMSAPQWVAHAGLDPAPFESGQSVHAPRHLSRQGNAYLRAALYMPALVAARWNAPVHAYYLRLLTRGLPKMSALCAVMRKLLHAIWGMFRHGQPFDPSRFSPDHSLITA